MKDLKEQSTPLTSLEAAASVATPDAGPAPVGRPRHLSEELDLLIGAFAERSVPLREVLEVTHGRGYTMLLILVTFPFCTPIPLPGFSAPFGLVVALIGFRLAVGQKPWLPARLLDARLPPRFFPHVLAASRRLLRVMERFLKPRLGHVLQWRVVRHGIGVMILACGLLMTLPVPIPLSNGLPAMAVLLLAAGMLEEDGCVAVAGGVLFLLTLAYFAGIVWGGAEMVGLFKGTLGDFLKPDDPVVSP